MTDGHNSDPSPTSEPRAGLPLAGRGDDTVAGHWLLARLGKRVLRPGGAQLTAAVLARAQLSDADVVELAPGLGRTAAEIIAHRPRSYLGVEQDPDAARAVRAIVGAHGTVEVADASSTGLASGSVDVVIGEAMLTMQAGTTKNAIIAEAARLLRPGGRYAIHELALTPDTVPEATKAAIRQALARSIRVNARPLTVAEWQHLLTGHGLLIDHVETAPMALLQLRRLIADEGFLGALRFATNLLTHPDARRRVLGMRHTFRHHRQHLAAVAVIAHKPDPATRPDAKHDRGSRDDGGRIS
jgi:SAM-dependent methyltransferase